jgi:hypothetical protein
MEYVPLRYSLRLATHLQGSDRRKSPKGASGAFLPRLASNNIEAGS